MCSASLKKLIQSRASEPEIHAHIKSDLSVLGEACTPSDIEGQYIAFSEFLILEDRPGFVVLTGESNMEIVLVEFKGADFKFLTSDVTIHPNIKTAARQVRDRFRHIVANAGAFRQRFDDIRREVEAGKTVYHSLRGSERRLGVDSAKQVLLKGMVIGGHSKESGPFSKMRHLLEREDPYITFDTWNNWLKADGQYGNILRSNSPPTR